MVEATGGQTEVLPVMADEIVGVLLTVIQRCAVISHGPIPATHTLPEVKLIGKVTLTESAVVVSGFPEFTPSDILAPAGAVKV
jgi:hypothetical protein